MATFAQQISDTANDGAYIPPPWGGYDPQNCAWGNLKGLFGGSSAILGYAGLRFVGVTIPQGATIQSATLTMPGVGIQSTGTVIGTLRMMAVDSAPALSQSTLTTGSRTTASRPTPSGQSNFAFDVATMLQEVVNRPGYAAGSAIAFVFDPSGADGYAFANDYSNDPANASSISVTYETGGSEITAKPFTMAMVI